MSIATTSWTPRSASVAMARSPIGPQPNDGHPLPRFHLGLVHRLHADGGRLGQRGNVQCHVVGHREQPPALGRLPDEEERGQAAFVGATPQPAQLLVGRVDDDPVTRRDPVHLAPAHSTTPAIS